MEIDGAPHAEDHGQAYDARRDSYLERVGLIVLRIPAEFVRDNLEAVLWDIAAAADQAANPKAPWAPCVEQRSTLPPEGEETTVLQ